MENPAANSDFKKTLRSEINRALIILFLIALFISVIDNWGDVRRGFNDGWNGRVPNPENTK